MLFTPRVQNGSSTPEYYEQGLGYDDGLLAVDLSGAIDHYSRGLPMTAEGRLCVEEASPTRVNNGFPFTANERIAVSNAYDDFTIWPLDDTIYSGDGTPFTWTRGDLKIFEDDTGAWKPAENYLNVITNRGYANKFENWTHDPTDTTGINDGTNVTTSLYDISLELQDNKQFEYLVDNGIMNGKVYRSTNSDPVSGRTVRYVGQVGNTNKHSCGILARFSKSGSVSIQLGSTVVSTTTVTAGVWTIIGFGDVTPLATNETVAIVIPADSYVDHILNHLTESETVQSYVTKKQGTTTVDRTWLDDNLIWKAASLEGWQVPALSGSYGLVEGQTTNKNVNDNDGFDATAIAGTATTEVVPLSAVPEPYQTQIRDKLGHLFDAGILYGVFKSTSVGTGLVTFPGDTTNTNVHSGSVFAVLTGTNPGSGSNVLRFNSPTTPDTDIPESFDRITLDGVTPAVSNAFLQMRIDGDNDLYWVLNQLEEEEKATSPVIIRGTTDSRSIDNFQMPMFADQWLSDSDPTDWTVASGASYSEGTLTLDAFAFSRIIGDCYNGGEAQGETLYFHFEAAAGTLSEFRYGLIDGVGGGTTVDTALTADYQWFTYSLAVDAAATKLDADIRNATTAAAGTIKVRNAHVSTSPIPTKVLTTTGTAKVWEMGNMFGDSEQIGGGAWVISGGTGVTTLDYGIAPDGRQKTSFLSDTDATVNKNWIWTGVCADDSETRKLKLAFAKNPSATANMAVRLRFSGGATQVNAYLTFNPDTGVINSTNVNVENESITTHPEDSRFWLLEFENTNNSSGNTAIDIGIWPAFNALNDTSGLGDVTAVGSCEVWGSQGIDYDVETDQYCPTWGSARKLKYNQVWENRMFLYMDIEYLGDDGSAFPNMFQTLEGATDFFRMYNIASSGNLTINRQVGGVNDFTSAATGVTSPYGQRIRWVFTTEPTDTANLKTIVDGVNIDSVPDTYVDDLKLGDVIRIGANISASAYVNMKVYEVKWGILPADGVSVEEVEALMNNIERVDHGLPFAGDSQIAINLVD